MKNNLKKLSAFLLVFCTFFLWSCEKEENSSSVQEKEMKREVELSDIPNLKNSIQNKQQNGLLGKNAGDYLSLINTEKIIQITQNDGSKTYTFALNMHETDTLTNLVAKENGNGFDYYLVKYSSPQFELWKTAIANREYSDVSVTIENISLDGYSNSARGSCFDFAYSCPSGQHNSISELGFCIFPPYEWTATTYAVPCDEGGGGGGGGGHGGPNPPPAPDPYTEPIIPTLSPAIPVFIASFSPVHTAWWNAANNDIKSDIVNYLNQNIRYDSIKIEAKLFVLELIDTLSNLEFENLNESREITKILIYSYNNNYFSKNLDSTFYQEIDQDSSLNFSDPTIAIYFGRLFMAHCALLKLENPTWSNYKIFGRAYLDTSHIILDFAGLVPIIGEIADLTNGTIYLVEGDGFNATLSLSSAIPVAGWFSAGIKMAKRTDGLRFVVVGTNNLISFGAANSTKFRAVCGIAVGDASQQAHHIIVRGSAIPNHTVVQKAGKALVNEGFHIDSALNEIAVATWRNQPNHNAYNALIKSKLDALPINLTPNQAYEQLMIIINQARQAIINNPNTHLNNLVF